MRRPPEAVRAHARPNRRTTRAGATLLAIFGLLASLLALSVSPAAAATPTPYEQGFETDASGWFDQPGDGTTNTRVTRVASGTDGLVSASGDHHAVVETPDNVKPFSRFAGYTDEFPGTYVAELDVYLDPAWALGAGFDYTVASNGSDGLHQRDFIFHITKDTSTQALLVGASNNTNGVPKENIESLANHAEIMTAGWYTMRHVFRNVGGVLAVDLELALGDDVVFTETRSNVADTIPAEVGGNRYAWFTALSPDHAVAIDDHELCVGVEACADIDDVCEVPAEHATIQAAIDQTGCLSIEIAAGTYPEAVNLHRAVDITGAGGGDDPSSSTIIDATGNATGFALNADGIEGDPIALTGFRVANASGAGIRDGAGSSWITLSDVTSADNGTTGIHLTSTLVNEGLVLQDVDLLDNGDGSSGVGLRVGSGTGVDGLTVEGGTVSGNLQGWYLACDSSASCNGSDVTNVSVTGTAFVDNGQKGIYAEKLSNATFQGVTVEGNGVDGGPAFDAGVDINLKWQDYQDITFRDSTFVDNGLGDEANGAGLTIKARDDGSYSSTPATLTNVLVERSSFSGNANGIRLGEPKANPADHNAGPTGVVVYQSCFDGDDDFELENVTGSQTMAEASFWGQADGPLAGQIEGDVDSAPWLVACPPITFPDVPESAPFQAEIQWMADNGITAGFDDGSFKPSSPVTRQAMSAFMYRLAGSPDFVAPGTATFSDVSVGHPFYDEIEWMAEEEITTGYDTTPRTYRPSAPVTRQAMSAFMYRLAGEPPFTAPGTPTFADVPPSAPFYDEIEWMAEEAITTGYDTTPRTYRPSAPVTRQAMSAFMFRLDPLLAP